MEKNFENKIKEINFISSFLTVICYILFVFAHRTDNYFVIITFTIFSLLNIYFISMGAIKTLKQRKLSFFKKSLTSIIVRSILTVAMLILILL